MSTMAETTSDKLSSAFMAEFLRNAGGTAIIDGGLATELERQGADLNDPLWSATCLLTSPHLIHKVFVLPLYLQLLVFLFVFVISVIRNRMIAFAICLISNSSGHLCCFERIIIIIVIIKLVWLIC